MTSKFTDVIEYLNTSVKNMSLFLFRMSYEFCWIFRNCSHNVTYVSALDILFCNKKLMDDILDPIFPQCERKIELSKQTITRI